MDNTVLKVYAAGLLHDLGKAGTRTTLGIDQEYIERHESIYLPVFHGRYSHHHALFGVGIVEKHPNIFPPEFLQREWGDGDTLINLIGAHHNPSTPLQWIIAVADRVSSGWDRDVFDRPEDEIPVKDYLKTRLLPVFEQLLADKDMYLAAEDFQYRYPLAPMSPSSIFPVGREEGQSLQNSPPREYEQLFDEFLERAEQLFHRTTSVELWVEHFDSLMMSYLSCIPAARAGNVVPDVSLYDHSRATAALAGALYLFHKEHGTLREADIKDYETDKFLIVAGDLYGIQDFIFKGYGDTRKHRSKLLRGRSLYVSLLTELASDKICRSIGLHRLASLLNAAGKFLIIAPNTEQARAAVEKADQEINDWLFDMTFGETSLGITYTSARAKDFAQKNFLSLWDRISFCVEKKKLTKLDLSQHGGVVGGYLDRFNNELHSPLCPICGKRPSSQMVEGSEYTDKENPSACELCRDQIFLGTQVVKNNTMAILSADADCGPDWLHLLKPIFGVYQVAFGSSDTWRTGKADDLIACWDIRSWETDPLASPITMKMINGYIPVYTEDDKYDDRILCTEKSDRKKLEAVEQINIGDPKTFTHLAAKALNWDREGGTWRGIDAIGVLKADVDDLGLLMSCGLKPERFTVSRLATLSRQLNAFFACYLPYRLSSNERFRNIYTVFGGGDDLFLIGPWNRMLGLAKELANDFVRYCCGNPNIHLSAGVLFCKPNTPLDTMAAEADRALESAKNGEKNQVSVFGETVPWLEMEALTSVREIMQDWYETGLVTRSMLYKLNELIHMASREKQVLSRTEIFLKDMHFSKWRALLAYFAERNVAKLLSKEERRDKVRHVSALLAQWLEHYGGKLKIPLWDILYNTR